MDCYIHDSSVPSTVKEKKLVQLVWVVVEAKG